MRDLPRHGHEPIGLDIAASPHTTHVGSISDAGLVRDAMSGADAVFHTATLHKPHVATHAKSDFVETNISGTLTLLEAAVAHGIDRFIFTSTTSAFGAALVPAADAPATWVDVAALAAPKNIYGVTKTAAEDMCHLFARRHQLNSAVLRVSRFFPEEDDNPEMRATYPDENSKANEFLFRRIDLSDIVSAHVAALDHVRTLGFDRYVISATTPFQKTDCQELRRDAPTVVARYFPQYAEIYAERGYRMFPDIGRVYDNARARRDLQWAPEFGFSRILQQLQQRQPIGSDLAHEIGSKGYHDEIFEDGPFPVE